MIDIKNLISLPYYTTKIPSTGKTVSFRPFVVKEEKILLIAKQSEDEQVIKNCLLEILKNCFKEEIDFENIPYFDAEYLFIQLRMKSMGEHVEVVVTDVNTKEKFDTEITLDKVKIINYDKNKSMDIKLNDNLAISMKYPPMKNLFGFSKSNEKESIYDTVADSIKAIYTKDKTIMTDELTKDQIKEFIDSLTNDMFVKIIPFFDKMPKVIYDDEFISPTSGNKIPVRITNFKDFFR